MLTVAEALDSILTTVRRLPAVGLPLEEALGLVLAEEIISEDDSPPFDKALMDGYAVRAEDVRSGQARLRVIEEVTAGRLPQKTLGPGEATRIMTGAPLPAGADAVVPIEETRAGDATGELPEVVIDGAPVTAGTNVLPRGAATKRGDRVLSSGRRLRPQEIGALAELGRATIQVYRRPRVAVLATGDELVTPGEKPGPGQIRNSNEPMLAAQIRAMGADAVPLGIARDERTHLRERIEAGLSCDMLLLSGGVSAGKLDLVPSELEAAGVQQVFHKIRMKPGKPLWFGILEQQRAGDREPAEGSTESRPPCYVFGLPGNPVSSMVCCELFARTAVRKLMDWEPAAPQAIPARLADEYVMRGNRPTYHPAHLEWTSTGPTVRAVDWIGSSDLRATVDANAMVFFPAGERTYVPGEIMDVFAW